MFTFQSRSLCLLALIFCSSFPAQAQLLCQSVFYSRPKLSLSGRTTPTLSEQASADRDRRQRQERLRNDSTQVSRDPELLRSLIKNRKYHSLSRLDSHGKKISWFLSLSDNGRFYRMVVRYDSSGQAVDMFADEPTSQVEKAYFHSIVQTYNIEALSAEINLPRRGKRELIIHPTILVKLDIKHEISGDMLLKALRQIPRHIKYRPNIDPRFAGKDSFLIFLDMSFRTPLEVVMVHEDDAYYIVTAFFPDTYRY